MSHPARWAYSREDNVSHLLAPGSDPTLGLVLNGEALAVRCGERLPQAVFVDEHPSRLRCADCELHFIADTGADDH